jgi:hypothetical protein
VSITRDATTKERRSMADSATPCKLANPTPIETYYTLNEVQKWIRRKRPGRTRLEALGLQSAFNSIWM